MVEALTPTVVTLNVPDVLPLGITSVGGADAAVFPLVSDKVTPPAGAAVPIKTVAVDVDPPITDAGLSVIDLTTGGLTVSTADALEPEFSAVIVAVV